MAAAVLGFRPHTYWTAAIALAGDADAPKVVRRWRIEFVDEPLRFAFHRAAEAPAGRAEAVIAEARAGQLATATAKVRRLISDLAADGYEARAAATAAAAAKLPERLDDILASHARIHTAEGDFARDVIADACAACGLAVHREVEKELAALLGDRLGGGPAAATSALADLGAKLGSPWNEDIKLAVLQGWLAL